MENKNENNSSIIPIGSTGLVRVGNTLAVTNKILTELSKRVQYIRIGCQEWASANLLVKEFRNGDPIPMINSNEEWSKLKTPAYCHYNNDRENEEKYGLLYNWYAVNDFRELAPKNWEIASEIDWSILNHFLGLSEAGKILKSKSIWETKSKGLDSFKFNGIPSGYRDYNGEFDYLGVNGYFWTKTENDEKTAWARGLNASKDTIGVYDYEKEGGMAVRCVRKVMNNNNEMSSSILEKAKDLWNKKDYINSIKMATQAIELNPGYQEAYYQRGLSYQYSDNQQEAIFNYNLSIYLNETYEAFYNRAFCKQRLWDFSGAIEDYTKSILLNPNIGGSYYNRGRAKFEFKDYEGARSDYNTAIQLDENLKRLTNYLDLI